MQHFSTKEPDKAAAVAAVRRGSTPYLAASCWSVLEQDTEQAPGLLTPRASQGLIGHNITLCCHIWKEQEKMQSDVFWIRSSVLCHASPWQPLKDCCVGALPRLSLWKTSHTQLVSLSLSRSLPCRFTGLLSDIHSVITALTTSTISVTADTHCVI